MSGPLSALAGWLGQALGGAAHIEGFAAPLWLLLLAPAIALALWRGARRRPAALRWPALAEARAAGGRFGDPVRGVSLALRGAAAVALALAIAGPLGPGQQVRLRHDGLDLLLVLDASGSMRALDTELDGGARTRLELARTVVARFAEQRAAEGDRVGLVVFGDRAFTQCPLTSDGRLLAAALGRVQAGMAGEATALGDALALAVRRIGAAEPEPAVPALAGPLAGRVVVLLTDGRSNAGTVPVEVATALAVQRGVRVHTVGIGSEGDVAMAAPHGGRALRMERHDLDAATLREIARATGGRAFLARSSADLPAVYAEIDRLERVPREAPPRFAGRPAPEPFLACAGALVALELLISGVVARRLP